VATSTALTPSTSAWWVFWISPTWPPSSPSTNPTAPERAAAVEQLGLEAFEERQELRPVAGRGQRGEPHVVGPRRSGRRRPRSAGRPSSGTALDPLAEPGDAMEAATRRGRARRRGGSGLRARRTARPPARVSAPTCDRRLEALEVQEAGVESTQPVVAHRGEGRRAGDRPDQRPPRASRRRGTGGAPEPNGPVVRLHGTPRTPPESSRLR